MHQTFLIDHFCSLLVLGLLAFCLLDSGEIDDR
jgi:hypothetical protein